MELSEYIRTSLLEILKGVRDAQDQDLAVAPSKINGKAIWTERMVTFEVAVEIDSSAKGGIRVLSFAETGAELKRTSINKVNFSVPIHMNVSPKPSPKGSGRT